MQERPDNFKQEGDDPEQTLVAPRFDAEEARRAHPVVPLAEARESSVNHPRAGRGLRRFWTPALMAVALLAVFAAGGVVATKVLRPSQPTPEAAQAPSVVAPAQAAEVPTQTAEAPTKAAEAPASVEPRPPVEAPREVTAEVPRAVADAKPEVPATRVRRAEDAGRAARGEGPRDGDEEFKDEHRGRRDKDRGKRRKHGEDDGEKEMREALKDARKKMPRLVDVLVRPQD